MAERQVQPPQQGQQQQSPPTSAALVARSKADTVRVALEKMTPQLKNALPRHLTPERLLRVTMTAVQKTPKLLDCDRKSLFAAVMTCAQLGLEPDGVLGQAYLVPFKTRDGMLVQFIPGYKGLLTLARNSGEITSVQAHEVCANDEFDYAYGLNERLDHKPAEGRARGPVTHFYAYAKFKDGGHVFEVMTVADIEKVRDESQGYKAFKAGAIKTNPWVTHFVQMGRKTAIRRLANYLPLQVQKAVEIENAYERGAPAALDTYGDLVVNAETGEILEGEATQIANDAGPAEEQQPAKGKKGTKAAPAAEEKAKPQDDAAEGEQQQEGDERPSEPADDKKPADGAQLQFE